MSTDFEKYTIQISEWFTKQGSKTEFLEVWNQAVSESADISRRMEITEETLLQVIGI